MVGSSARSTEDFPDALGPTNTVKGVILRDRFRTARKFLMLTSVSIALGV